MLEKEKQPGVIILGGHVQGYGIVRIFGENNIPTIVIDQTKYNIARHSKYCLEFYKSSYNELMGLFKDFIKKNKFQNWLIFPTDDYYVKIISENKTLLESYFKVTVDDWDVIQLFYNKRNTYPLAESVGIPIPKTFFPSDFKDLKLISKKITFPCIIKPAVMLDFYRHFKKKVFVCNNINDLEINFNKAVKIIKPDETIIQEIIPGSSEHQYSVGIFFNRSISYNYLVARRKRQHPIDFGNATTFAETVEIPELVEYAEKLLMKANYFGICEVEFKYDERDNKYKFLEVNPRTWKWHLISEKAGIPFLLSLYNYFYNLSPIIAKVYQISSWKDLLTDIQVVAKLIKINSFYKSNISNSISAVANKKDLLPFVYQLLYLPMNIIKR